MTNSLLTPLLVILLLLSSGCATRPELSPLRQEMANAENSGYQAYQKGKMVSALHAYLRAYRLSQMLNKPIDSGKLAFRIANLYRYLGQVEAALIYYQQAKQLVPEAEPSGLYLQIETGFLQLRFQKGEDIETSLLKLISLADSSSKPDLYLLYSSLLKRQGRLTEAKEQLDLVKKITPSLVKEPAALIWHEAEWYWLNQDYSKAAGLAQHAMELDSKLENLQALLDDYWLLAKIAESLGDTLKARHHQYQYQQVKARLQQ